MPYMLHHKRALLLFLGIVVVAGITTVRSLPARKQDPSAKRKKEYAREQYDPRKIPTTDYGKSEPSDPEKQNLRQTRDNRFKFKNNVDPKRFAITEDSQSSYGTFEIHAKPEPAIPAAQSDAIVIGEVKDAEAFLTREKTSIYSEFTVNIGEVLKGISPVVFPGTLITATRGGGAVRFPSGKVVCRGFEGKPFPQIGRRYVFFLKAHLDGGWDFSIITAYELRDRRVIPLDGLSTDGATVIQLAAHQQRDGADETSFLSAVREAIARDQSSMRQGGS